MGLDMYLKGNLYLSDYIDRTKDLYQKVNDLCKDQYGPMKVNEIVFTAAYWRKSNQIHRWFVDNVQDGNDDCGTYFVSHEQLQELVDLCKEVLADKSMASELLPTQEGFFFGGTGYDEWYFGDLEETIKMLEPLIIDSKYENLNFYYHSSW